MPFPSPRSSLEPINSWMMIQFLGLAHRAPLALVTSSPRSPVPHPQVCPSPLAPPCALCSSCHAISSFTLRCLLTDWNIPRFPPIADAQVLVTPLLTCPIFWEALSDLPSLTGAAPGP